MATGSVVDIYKTAGCSGVTIPAVADNSTTQIAVIAEEGTRKSTCSVPITYVEDSDFDNDGLNDDVDPDDDNDGILDGPDNCDLAPTRLRRTRTATRSATRAIPTMTTTA